MRRFPHFDLDNHSLRFVEELDYSILMIIVNAIAKIRGSHVAILSRSR